jgi:hypothetical protein
MRTRVAATACATVMFSYLAAHGVSAPLWAIVPTVAIFSYVVLAAGDVLLRAFRAAEITIAASWTLGLVGTAIALSALVLSLQCTAAAAFCGWAILVFVLDFATRQREVRGGIPRAQDALGFLFCCAFAAAWCKDVAAAPKLLEHTGHLRPWVEYLMHAGVISELGDERAVGRGLIWLVDAPLFAYHYASYAVAAAFALPLDEPGLPIATSVLLPLGLLTVATAAYTLGTCFAGTVGGLGALLAIFALPDPSNYGLRNGFFSFHWMLVAIPGSAYGLASALLALAFLQRWSVERTRHALVASASIVGATLLMRMQVFVLLAPAWIACVAYVAGVHKRPRIVLGIVALLAAGAVLLLLHPPDLPSNLAWAFDGGRALEQFLFQVHRRQEPTAYQGLYASILSVFGDEAGLTIGTLLVYPVCLGAFLLALPVAYLLHRRAKLVFSISFPLMLLLWFGVIMALAPIPAHGDATEFPHRSFVLLYATFAIWTFGLSIRLLSETGSHGSHLWQTVAVASMVALPFTWITAGSLERPKPHWARFWVNYPVQPELLAASAILRSRSASGDVFAMPVREMSITNADAQTIVVALTGMPSYLARIGVQRMLGGVYSDVSSQRFQELRAIEAAADGTSALHKLATLGIRWYLVVEPGAPGWDPGRTRAVWSQGTAALYDTASAASQAP